MNKENKLLTNLGPLELDNPVLVASGTFGYGLEFEDLVDLNKLGGIITKTITLNPREGNPQPRLVETPSGMINSIGLQNNGVEYFINNILPQLEGLTTSLIVNIAGNTIEEYAEVAGILSQHKKVKALELNISCPNVKEGGIAFGTDAKTTEKLVSLVRKETNLPLIAKLTPNVSNIVEIAEAAVDSGAEILSLINTVLGVGFISSNKAETNSFKALRGGLSGPAIKPIALRLVNEIYKNVKVPIIGLGGITNFEDALEFFLCGASAIAVGTTNFVDPTSTIQIVEQLEQYLKDKNIESIIGKVEL